jgi:hypothetical protein
LISLLDEKGRPTPTERCFVLPPWSRIGPVTPDERKLIIEHSLVAGVYEQTVDRESAFEVLKGQTQAAAPAPAPASTAPAGGPVFSGAGGRRASAPAPAPADSGTTQAVKEVLFGRTGPRGGKHEGLVESAARSAMRSIGSGVGREIVRGILGGILGGKRR